jgi:hypothetical protein
MKTLKNQTLLYDEECPLCRVYTKGFITTGMLDENGKKPYCQLTEEEQNFIDVQRASNEIALVDNENKTVLYGIDSLLKVIGFSFPWMEKIGNWKLINFLLKKLYSFISYNRKVIMPSKKKTEIKLECVPDFNVRYRFLYITLATVFTVFTLFYFSELLSNLPKSNIAREFILAIGQMVFQSLFLLKKDKKTILNYLGNLMTVSLLGSLILVPMIFLNSIIKLPEIVILGGFACTVLIMFLEHSRRIKILELPKHLTYTWVLYRIIALVIILNT